METIDVMETPSNLFEEASDSKYLNKIDIEVWDPCYLTNKMVKIFDFVVAFRI